MSHPLLDEGLDELLRVLEGTASLRTDRLAVVADLSVARGLDYYTGTVFETRMAGFEHLGSICSGRPLRRARHRRPDDVPRGRHLVRRHPHARAAAVARPAQRVAQHAQLRPGRGAGRGRPGPGRRGGRPPCAGRGVPAEVSPAAQKYGKQIRYAERRGIPFVWFPQDDGSHQVRDIRTGEQVDADLQAWVPPAEDLRPSVTGAVATDS